ncbi:hypothetical protein I2I05_20675 [Hymenobacter sp. BT683]|uniref:STAS/SEC14 domain-containing protein n=1 Tax=Hymenobacter jeongseonensis TaxID=2791027 RepID=A0ABS0IN74_9BACT|nr:hypothetical protein [Hymenobacter jeongseonensis]MBF9239821.1 hypothetical protein [Hymenobacter jeongseonensis]
MSALAFYDLAYHADPPLLRGRHLRPLRAEEVTESCELVLAAARRRDCAGWLLDGRATPYGQPPALRHWLREDYWPRVQAALGRPVRVAFLVTPAVRLELDRLGYEQAEALPLGVGHVGWFLEEEDALAWLAP